MTATPPLTNWAGNLTYSTTRVWEAGSLEQVRAIVRSSEKLKVLGSRHCFNSIADSRFGFLSLKPMREIVALDKAAPSVTVEAGIAYGDLCPWLDRKGFALHNLASLPHISVAGACGTATHGSGERCGNLSTAVSALEMVTAEGDVVNLSRADGDTFRAAAVGLGAFGAVTKITLEIEPAFTMRQYVYQNLPLEQACHHFDEIQSSAYSVSLFTDWREPRFNEVWIKTRTDGARQPFAAPPEFFGAMPATRNLHPIGDLPAENCTAQMGERGPWYERLPHFRMGYMPSAGKELQTEYLVPRRHAIDAILAIDRLRDRIAPHLLISEIRAIAADDLWMSTACARLSIAIHFTWQQDWPTVSRLLPLIEQELSPFEPRPHWGKLFTVPPAELRRRYEKLDDFAALAKQFDPAGKFRNDFLADNIFN